MKTSGWPRGTLRNAGRARTNGSNAPLRGRIQGRRFRPTPHTLKEYPQDRGRSDGRQRQELRDIRFRGIGPLRKRPTRPSAVDRAVRPTKKYVILGGNAWPTNAAGLTGAQ